ncbi:MAG: L-threonylcarbamoyladenylate synthase [Bacteroidota bacterium]
MPTQLTTDPAEAAALLRDGGVVAFPTETVYGLGADALNPDAVARIFTAKGRPADNPLIVHVAEIDAIRAVTSVLPSVAEAFIEAFFPGPLTLILPKATSVPGAVTAGLNTVGVRMPDHALALDFLRACATPVAAPSANRSGRPSPTTWPAVQHDLDGRIDAILQGDLARVGLESTVLDCTGEAPVILRAGAVTLEMLRHVAPATKYAHAASDALQRSPGTRYRHYAPDAIVRLVDTPHHGEADPMHGYIGLTAPAAPQAWGLCHTCTDVADYGHRLYETLREADRRGLSTVYCQRVSEDDLGRALMDRLQRAAAR